VRVRSFGGGERNCEEYEVRSKRKNNQRGSMYSLGEIVGRGSDAPMISLTSRVLRQLHKFWKPHLSPHGS
jgi:hypothetical protein